MNNCAGIPRTTCRTAKPRRWLAERYLRIERDNEQIRQKIAAATNSLARTFDRIVVLLTERGFIDGNDGDPKVHRRRPAAGPDLQRERPIGRRVPAQRHLGGTGRCGTRGGGVVGALRDPRRRARRARRNRRAAPASCAVRLNQTRRLWTELRADEQRHRVTQSREPEDGFVAAIYRWATTGDLTTALAASDASGTGTPLSAGDFVRWCRQVLDLLDQVRNAAPTPRLLRATAKRAINDIRPRRRGC